MYPSVLIVDDEKSIIESLEGILSDDGFEVMHAHNGYEALKKIETLSPDIVLLDIWMPGIDGIETLKEIKKIEPALPVIMITGHGSIQSAVNATKSGAYDFLEKPLSINKIIVSINNALNFRKLEEENIYLRKKSIEKNSITGNSPDVQKLYQQITKAAPSNASILIRGESGTGKELVAQTIHQLSSRSEKPFIIINCASISQETIDSELFGHEKGAIKTNFAKSKGKFELASFGTLFLDEIGDMNLNSQAKILRVLESKTFQRIGSSRTLHMKARLITSSNKDLETLVDKGLFRQDLFYRLNTIPVIVPPLRTRKQDIPLLVDSFLHSFAQQSSQNKKNISQKALDLLFEYDWPGNVRELKNLVERLCIMCKSNKIDVNDLPSFFNAKTKKTRLLELDLSSFGDTLLNAKKNFEKQFVLQKISIEKENLKVVAKKLGTSIKYIKKIIEK